MSASISMARGGGRLTVTGVPMSQADDILGASYPVRPAHWYERDHRTHSWLRGYTCTRANRHADCVLRSPAYAAADTTEALQGRSSWKGEGDFEGSGGLTSMVLHRPSCAEAIFAFSASLHSISKALQQSGSSEQCKRTKRRMDILNRCLS